MNDNHNNPTTLLKSLGDYQFDMEPVAPQVNCFKFSIGTSHMSDDSYRKFDFDIADTDPILLIQTILEIEAITHLTRDDYFYLFSIFKNLDESSEGPWSWLLDFPYNYDIDEHYRIEDYQIYHYNGRGQKTLIHFKNERVRDEIQQIKTGDNAQFKDQCDAIIERETLSLRVAKSTNQGLKSAHKI